MTQIEGGHIDDRVGAVPGPDSVNRRVSGPGTEPGSVPGLARLNWPYVNGAYDGQNFRLLEFDRVRVTGET